MPFRRFGRPGLIGLAARTAVVAGTATAVQGVAMRNREQRAQGQYEQEQYAAAQQQAQVDAAAQNAAAQYAPATAPAAAPSSADDMISKLQQLASLKNSGVLSEEEFAAAKQKLLS